MIRLIVCILCAASAFGLTARYFSSSFYVAGTAAIIAVYCTARLGKD